VLRVRTAATATKSIHKNMNLLLAEITGNIASAFGLLGAAIGVGLIGNKAAEAVGRNPGASGKILVQAIIGMALAEGLGILALFLAK
jgi:F-type H+-transporting ATPase subunit c